MVDVSLDEDYHEEDEEVEGGDGGGAGRSLQRTRSGTVRRIPSQAATLRRGSLADSQAQHREIMARAAALH